MINVNEQITKLVDNLNEFLNISHNTLTDVLNGMILSRNLISENKEKANISRVIDKIFDVDEMIFSFKIGIKDTNNQLWLYWDKTGSQEKYDYSDDKELTEKMFNFILMSFDREIFQRLSVIEESNDGYIYFCYSIKNRLHSLITDYMKA